MKLWIDRETFGEADLTEVGGYKYAETAYDILFGWAVDDGPAHVWEPLYEDPPSELIDACLEANEVWAHNSNFDRNIHQRQTRLPQIELLRWRCTMAQALSHALPAGLGDLCSVLGVPEDMAKLKEGKKLLRLFTRPQPKNRKVQRPNRETHPEEWARFREYQKLDIIAMRECHRRMPTWNWNSQCIPEWHMDQRINDRGFQVDTELAAAGVRASAAEIDRLGGRFRELTMGLVDRPSQRAQLMAYLNTRYGLDIDNTRSDTFLQLIKEGVECAELLQLCISANKTSTAKYAALAPATQSDGRFRGGLQFAGAGRTRRWAGRMFQGQNLPSRGLPPAASVELFIEHVKTGTHQVMFGDQTMWHSAAGLRGLVIAKPGHKLVVSDLSNIEGRKLSWFANEEWKLKAFREYDAGTGPDLYNVTAVSLVGGDPWNVPKAVRNVFGKVPDLASGYMGGVAGYQTFAKAYNVRMADHWGTISKLPFVDKARENLEKWGRPQMESMEISEIEWLASEVCKLAWRFRHPATVTFWYDLQDAVKAAIRNPGITYHVGDKLAMSVVKHKGINWLAIRLPSGRYLTYFEPRLVDDSIVYEGMSTEEGKTQRIWTTIYTHGGKVTGNVCQTSARDLLAQALLEAEPKYPTVLSVHDEGVTEVPDDPLYDSEGLCAILAKQRSWTEGLPLAAAGFETYRYKKDE